MLLFSILNKIFFGYFYAENVFLGNANNILQGELTDISAKKEALAALRTDVQPAHGATR